jgi:hypothetical protein
VRDDEVDASAADRQSVHRRQGETQIDTGSTFGRRTEHRPREIRTDDRDPDLASGTALRPAPQPMSSTRILLR